MVKDSVRVPLLPTDLLGQPLRHQTVYLERSFAPWAAFRARPRGSVRLGAGRLGRPSESSLNLGKTVTLALVCLCKPSYDRVRLAATS